MPKVKGKVTIAGGIILPTELSPTYFGIDEQGYIMAVGVPGLIPSTPPSGYCRITNLYVNDKGKLYIEFDDEPV